MPENSYVPSRKCIACRKVLPKPQLLRVVLTQDGLTADPEGKLQGRGCYVCRNASCIGTAIEKNFFARSFKKGIPKAWLEALRKQTEKYF